MESNKMYYCASDIVQEVRYSPLTMKNVQNFHVQCVLPVFDIDKYAFPRYKLGALCCGNYITGKCISEKCAASHRQTSPLT